MYGVIRGFKAKDALELPEDSSQQPTNVVTANGSTPGS